ncbi:MULTISPECIES: hypothetical protein [unclassified Pseudomonas]|uniref:hypothetical protein n=1 Tax=unclassified Pseudomonas TaxID=196821 RepID=UPI00236042A2|nr:MULTISPECIES: hypothetical protein [unclassified Pseudomonas]MDR6179401.1 hypothetical protein [Pseudomonas sp. SORGH_AS_0211]
MTAKQHPLDADQTLSNPSAAFARAAQAAVPATPAGTFDGVSYYAFQNQPRLTLDINAAAAKVGFAKTFDANGPHYTAGSTLNEVSLIGHYEEQRTLLDGHTRGTTPGDTSLDSSIAKLTVSLTDVPTNDLNLWSHVDLSNFDGLQTFDGSQSTVGLFIDLTNAYRSDGPDVRSESAFLKTVTTGSAGDFLYVSTIAAAELDSVAALGNSRVKPLTIDTGAGGDDISAYIQQADMVINAGAGGDSIDLSIEKGVAAHNATVRGNYGHGATITLGEGRDYLIVDTLGNGTLANFDGSSSAAANRSLAANHVTITDYQASEDQLIFGFSIQKPEAVTTVADAALKGANSLYGALQQVAQSMAYNERAAVFHYGSDTYVLHNVGDTGQIDAADSLIQLVGIQDLQDVAGTVSAGPRGIGS